MRAFEEINPLVEDNEESRPHSSGQDGRIIQLLWARFNCNLPWKVLPSIAT